MFRLFTIFALAMILMTPVSADAMDWIVSPDEAAKVAGAATVLDTRSALKFGWKHVAGSQRVAWDDFTLEGARRGVLRDDASLQKKLRELGVSSGRPVLVVGNPRAWGEDGRIVWMLRTLGHERAAMVDGGFDALVGSGVETSRGTGATVSAGDFVVKRTSRYDADRAAVEKALSEKSAVFLDTREEREFEGKTPYGESRGGHVPGARHLHFKSLIGDDGRLLPREAIEAKLAAVGITRSSDVIAYCTGGVRSGWMVAVLQSLGYAGAKNYAGSMWEWAAADAATHPLEK